MVFFFEYVKKHFSILNIKSQLCKDINKKSHIHLKQQ